MTEIQPGVCYRHPEDTWPTAEDYDEAIADLQLARQQLRPDGNHCAVCGDSGHQAMECHHNPLLLARKWTKASSVWRCWHCQFVATTDEEAVAHFGRSDDEPAACQADPALDVAPAQYSEMEQRALDIAERFRNSELAETMARAQIEVAGQILRDATAAGRPVIEDPGTSPELLAKLARKPFSLSRADDGF